MDEILEIFEGYEPDREGLIDHGFKEENGSLFKCLSLHDGQFELRIRISDKITLGVFESDSEEEYLPFYARHYSGGFVGEIREECFKMLMDLRDCCFKRIEKCFGQRGRILGLVEEKYGDVIDHLFEASEVFRCRDNDKWFGLTMNIDRDRFSDRKGKADVMNLKGEPLKIDEMIDDVSIFRAYHMNKKHWYTIVLDGSISDEKIMEMIDESYELVK